MNIVLSIVTSLLEDRHPNQTSPLTSGSLLRKSSIINGDRIPAVGGGGRVREEGGSADLAKGGDLILGDYVPGYLSGFIIICI